MLHHYTFSFSTCKRSRIKPARLVFGMFLLFFLVPALSQAQQEICNNGIDDDGDNLVDVFDPDCPCDDQILLCQPSCEFVSPGGQLNFNSQWASADTIPVYQTPLVGDIDNDGVPEAIFLSSNSLVTGEPRRAKDILIINGVTGATETTITTPFVAWVGPTPFAMADIDGDGFGEIIVAAMDHSDNTAATRRHLVCYEHTGALKWVSDSTFGNAASARFGSSVGIADFNNDGVAEVYVYNQIFNAATGKLLASGGNANGQGIMTNQAFGDLANPVAADITTDPGLELAAGNTVYNVTITNLSGLTGNAMIPITIAGHADGYTSVADIDLDGNMDIVVASQGSTGELYVWNPGNGTPFLIASRTFSNTGSNWIGVPFIGDMDKDCEPEIGVTRAQRVYALDYDGTSTLATKWTLITSDGSGFTGITMFDFNQDGTQELVYRDESQLRIIDGSGSTPVTIGSNPCASGTGTEMAVVADIDGDGRAEICVSCATIDNNRGQLQVFESAGQPWAPCRKVWNQYSYFNVNINSNLSVPIQQQQHQVLLSTVTCPFYNCSENRPFNTFLAQATFLTQDGCPIYPASNVALSTSATSCNGSFQYNISVEVENVGSAASDSGYPVRFYAGNPFSSSAIVLPIISGPSGTPASLDPDETVILSYVIDITEPEKPFTLFAVLNDDGSAASPFAFPLSALPECDYSDNVVVISNVDCCPAGDLSIDQLIPPSAEFCEGESQIFSVDVSSSAGLTQSVTTWTLPGNIELTADSITVSDAGTYSVTIEDNAHCLVSQSFNVNAVPLPTAAAAGSDQEICSDQTTLQGNIPVIGTGAWSIVSGAGNIVTPSSPSSSVNNIPVGTTVMAWSITSGSTCVSSDTIQITRVPQADIAAAGADQQICDTQTTLDANLPTVGTGSWSVVSGAGTFTDPADPQTTVTGLASGTNVFRWTISDAVCPPTADDVNITRFEPPAGAFAGADQQICSDTTTLNAQGSGVWSLISGNATISDPSNNQAVVSGLQPGVYELEWTVTIGTCPAVSDTMQIQVDEPPSVANAGEDQQICADEIQLQAEAPVSGTPLWSVISGGAVLNDPTLPGATLSNIAIGANVLVYTVSGGNSCPATSDTLSITRDALPDEALAGADQEVCGNQASLSGNQPLTGTPLWSNVSGDATIADPGLAGTSVQINTPGTVVLQYSISNGVCPPSTDEVSLISYEVPQNVDAGEALSICDESVALQAALPDAGTGQWTILNGNATLVSDTDPNSIIQIPGFETIQLEWTVTNGVCVVSDQTTVTRNEPPSAAEAGPDQELCGTTAQLDATAPASGSGTWSVVSSTASFSDASSPSSSVSGLSVGVNLLVWTVSSGDCPANSDTLLLTVSEDPVEPDAGPDQQICTSSTILDAAAPVAGTGEWTLISGTAVIADPSDPQSELTGIEPGTVVLRFTITNGACVAFDEVNITRSEEPTPAAAGTDTSICEGTSLVLNANAPAIGTGTWSSSAAGLIFTEPGNPATQVNGFAEGVVNLVWTITNGACEPSSDSIQVTVAANNLIADAGSDLEICSDTVTLNALGEINGTLLWEISSGSGSLSNPANASTLLSGLQPGTTTVTLTVSNDACPAATDEINITVNELPDPADAGEDQQVCGEATVLGATSPGTGSGTWTVVTGNAVFDDDNDPQSAVSGLNSGVNVLQWTVTSGVCPPQSDQVVIISDSVAIAMAGPDLQTCNGAEITLQAGEPNPGAGLWTISSGDGTFSDATSPLSNFTPAGNGSITLVWTVTTGNCEPVSDTMQVVSLDLPGPAAAGNDTSICSTLLILQAQTPVSGTGSWSSPQMLTFSDPQSPAATVEMMQPGVNELIWTVGNVACPSVSDTILITVSKQPITPNAGPDMSICAFETQLSAGLPAEGTGEWTLVEGAGTISDPADPNSSVSELQAGTNVFRWTVTLGECVAFDEMQLVVSEPPSQADAGPDITVCGDFAQLSAEEPVSGSGSWSLISGSGSFSDAADAQSTVSGLEAGQNTFAWTVTSGACKPSVDFVVVTRDTTIPPADAGEDLEICADTVTLNANPAAGGYWQVISGTAAFTDSTQANTLLSAIETGSTVLQWTIPASGTCPESSDQITIVRAEPPTQAVVGDDMMICSDEVQLVGNEPAIGTGTWLVIGGNGVITDPASAITTATGLEPGNNVFEWRITNGVCPPSSEEITIARGDTAYAGADQTICDSSATLSAVLPAGLSGFWTLVSGAAEFADSTQAQTQVSNLAQGENVFLWTVLGGFCPDSTDQVTINVTCNIPPVIINDTLQLFEDSVLTGNIINGDFDPDSTQLTADTVLVLEPGNGTFVINPDGSFTYTPDPNYFGNDTVIVQICDNGTPLPELCDNDTIYIVVLPVNDAPDLVSDTVSTQPGETVSGNLNDNNSDIEDDTLLVNTDPVVEPDNGTITINPDGSFTYEPDDGFTGSDTIVVEICDGPPLPLDTICGLDTLIIIVQELELMAFAGNDTTVCGSIFNLMGNDPAPGTGVWTVIEGNATVQNNTQFSTVATGLNTGANTFVWTVSESGQSVSDTVTITVVDVPPAFAGEDQTICGNQTTLQGSDPGDAIVSWSVVSGSGLITNAGNVNAIVTGIQPGETVITYILFVGECLTSDTMSVFALPVANVQLMADTSICPQVTSLTIQGSASPAQGSWSVISGNAVFDSETASTTISQLADGQNVLVYTSGESPCTANDTLVITVLSENDADCAGIYIPEGFSPNGDASNDEFVIYGTQNLDVSIKVFNRWGNLVYENAHYLSDWDGTCNQSGVLYGEILPSGTYYYLVQIEGESSTRKGYLILWR